ncbi:MAG: ATP-grasp domain-containing protein [Deltaproteobacteria bacterium]|nr:ATP-grasp domain-containing protein [Deltaproteobacteria bacterium]
MSEGRITVLIPDADTWDALKVTRCLGRTSRIRTRILATQATSLARFSRHCDGYHRTTAQLGSDAWPDAVRELVTRLGVDVVLPVTEKGTAAVVSHRDALSSLAALAPLPAGDRLELARDKWELNQLARNHHIPVLPASFLGAPGDPLPDLDGNPFPALVKATSLAGGDGITSVADHDALERLWSALAESRRPTRYMLQSYAPGIDFCMGMLCHDGEIVAHTIQRSQDVAKVRFGPQRSMRFVHDAELLALNRKLARALDWNGVAYVDFRHDSRDQTYKLLELNARFGQAVMGSLAAGVNFPLRCCLSALGEEPPAESYREIEYLQPEAFLRTWISAPLGGSRAARSSPRRSGVRFVLSDPLPEITVLFRRLSRRF